MIKRFMYIFDGAVWLAEKLKKNITFNNKIATGGFDNIIYISEEILDSKCRLFDWKKHIPLNLLSLLPCYSDDLIFIVN